MPPDKIRPVYEQSTFPDDCLAPTLTLHRTWEGTALAQTLQLNPMPSTICTIAADTRHMGQHGMAPLKPPPFPTTTSYKLHHPIASSHRKREKNQNYLRQTACIHASIVGIFARRKAPLLWNQNTRFVLQNTWLLVTYHVLSSIITA